jgi:DNA repair exonuclease SbcCD nuclease subunit
MKESTALISFVIDKAKEFDVDCVEILGDLFDTHSVIRSEVLDFWDMAFKILEMEGISTRVMIGNHDQIGDKEREQSLNALNVFCNKYKFVNILNTTQVINGIIYIPHTSDPELFLKRTQMGGKLLIAHQTFIGAEYESGFPAEDGIDIDSVPQEAIISGHIHKSQQIGKVFYPGAPRWLKSTDADTDKGIWLFEHNKENPAIYIKEFISTREVVTPIIKIVFKEGDEEPTLPDNAKVALELIGESSWIAKMRKKYKGKASIRAVPSDRKASSVDKSKLVDIEQFLAGYVKPNDSFGVQDVIEYIRGVS